MMKNNIIAGLVLGLAITAGGWAVAHDNQNMLKEVVVEQKDDIQSKSTKIANLDDAIVKKDNDLKAKEMVIDKQNTQINKQKEEIDKLKKELKKKPKVVDKTVYKSSKVNFNNKKEGSGVGGRKINVEATAYIAMCSEGCTGKTATGENVSDSIYYQGHRVIAVDTSLIPLNSLVRVETGNQSFTAMAIDTGGAINGHKIDVLVGSTSDARQFGVQKATITVLKEGK